MRKVIFTLAMAGIMSSVALAAHDEASASKKFQSEVITGYQSCVTSSPNDSTSDSALPLPACSPAVRNDTQCGLGNIGKGKIAAKLGKADIALQAGVKGITGCTGETLCFVIGTRVTTDDCVNNPAGACTIQASLTSAFQVGGAFPACCIVDAKGGCKIKTTVNTAVAAGTIIAGKNTGFEVLSAGLQRVTGTPPAGPAISAGIVVK